MGFTSRIEERSTHCGRATSAPEPELTAHQLNNHSIRTLPLMRHSHAGVANMVRPLIKSSSHDHDNTIPWKPIATQAGNSIQFLPNPADVISFIKSNAKKKFYRIPDVGRVQESRGNLLNRQRYMHSGGEYMHLSGSVGLLKS
jgi:hypothetical protein